MAISAQQAQIGALYVAYFGRSTDPAGLAYWVGQLNNGLSLARIAQSFAVQPEATAIYPFLANPTAAGLTGFITSVYSNLFNRTMDLEGLAYWSGQVNAGRPVGSLIADMISGAQGDDLRTVNNKTTVAVEYAQAFEMAGKTWTSTDLSSARSVLVGVTFDPATVTAAQSKIHDIVNPTPTPTPTPAPTPTPPPPVATITLTLPGEQVALNGTTGTISLTGEDLATYPAASFGTIALASARGMVQIVATAGATLSAAGNAAATTFNFGSGVVEGSDPVNSKLAYFGFTKYIASAHGDTVTLSAGGQEVVGGVGNDTINGGPGTHLVSGGGGADTFNVTAGSVTISDFNNGADVLTVSAAGSVNAIVSTAWTATAASSNANAADKASIASQGVDVDVSAAGSVNGWQLVNQLGTGAKFVGSAKDDILIGGSGDDMLTGGAGDDAMTGNGGADTFIVDFGADQVLDLANGNDVLKVSGGASVIAILDASWTPVATTQNEGSATVNINAKDLTLDLSSATGASGWTVLIMATGGSSTVIGSSKADIITGLSGNATVTGGGGADTFNVDSGTDTISDLGAGDLVDILVVSDGATASATLTGNWIAGNTTTLNASGAATVNANGFTLDISGISAGSTANGWSLTNSGSFTSATITGSSQNDSIVGSSNVADTLNGGDGNDLLRGLAGNDTLNGGNDDDTIDGNSEADTLTGGAGIDTFGTGSLFGGVTQGVTRTATTFTTIAAGQTITFGNGVDRVMDFEQGTDKLDVVNAATAPTNLDGFNSATAGVFGITYVLYGTWDGTDTFTAAANFDGATAKDALVVRGAGGSVVMNSDLNAGWVVMLGLTNALAAGDFV